MKVDPSEASCRVTMQYRRGAGKVFELESGGQMLDVHVTPEDGQDSANHWRVAAYDRRTLGAIAISETGATRDEALEKVGRAWIEQTATRNLTSFDWVAVTNTLRAIRAI